MGPLKKRPSWKDVGPGVAALIVLAAVPARAQDQSNSFDMPGRYGLGLSLSDIGLGATVKAFIPGALPLAVQASLGLGFVWVDGFLANADLLYEMLRFHRDMSVAFNWYVGLGGTVGFAAPICRPGDCVDALLAGGQLVGGVAMQLQKVPLEATLEWRPGFLVGGDFAGPWSEVNLWSFAVACRYFFR